MKITMKLMATIIISGLVISGSIFAKGNGSLQGKVSIKSKGLFGKKGKKSNASNVVIFLESLKQPNKNMNATLMQKGKKFSPRVVPIIMGGSVSFPNKQNVFSPTQGYKFDLGYYGSGKSKKVRFNKTGSVRIYCNIHSSMVADILVVPNQFYSKTKSNGNYKIKNIPAGKYTFVAWQPTGASERRNVVIKAGQKTKVNFEVVETVFKVKHKNKYGQAYEKDY